MKRGRFYTKMNRINDKIKEIDDYLEKLLDIIPQDVEDYKKDHKRIAACERYFERIVEAVIDSCFLLIKKKDLKAPEEEEKVFDILEQNKIISKELVEKLKEAKGMRNIIAHEYGKVDDELVFEAITQELEKDVNEFIKSVEKLDE